MFSIFKKKKEFASIILAPVDGVYSDVSGQHRWKNEAVIAKSH